MRMSTANTATVTIPPDIFSEDEAGVGEGGGAVVGEGGGAVVGEGGGGGGTISPLQQNLP